MTERVVRERIGRMEGDERRGRRGGSDMKRGLESKIEK